MTSVYIGSCEIGFDGPDGSSFFPRQAALTTFDRRYIDILVSNAAVNPMGSPILQMEDSVIEKILQINVQSAIWLVREAVKHMTAGGSIILNSSFTAFNPSPPLAMYAVSKTALVSFVT